MFQLALKNSKQISVLLGVTSSGTSQIGHCGGIDNPTHYTRIKVIYQGVLTNFDKLLVVSLQKMFNTFGFHSESDIFENNYNLIKCTFKAF